VTTPTRAGRNSFFTSPQGLLQTALREHKRFLSFLLSVSSHTASADNGGISLSFESRMYYLVSFLLLLRAALVGYKPVDFTIKKSLCLAHGVSFRAGICSFAEYALGIHSGFSLFVLSITQL
jgi:hypothetical protein